jgi:hypothetical protein
MKFRQKAECKKAFLEDHKAIFYLYLGRQVYATQIRDNEEIAYVVNNQNYDFNYQYYNFLAEPITFKRVS